MLRLSVLAALLGTASALRMSISPKKVLVIGGTRFSGAYLWKELVDRGHEVTLYNRGKTPPAAIPGESEGDFEKRMKATAFITGDRKDATQLMEKLGATPFEVCYDMNGREAADTEPLLDALKKGSPSLEHFVYMSSAGVYLKSEKMPHVEGDEVDQSSRHKGKLATEELLAKAGVPWTSIRPTYIYGAGNYNPLEQYFFERVHADRPVCVPGYGGHLTGLGHVKDLAVAMANVIGRPQAVGKVYNVQDDVAISFDGLVRACAKAAGKDPAAVEIVHYNPKDFDFGKKKAFPLRPQHFWTDVELARKDLEWAPTFDTEKGLADAFENDFAIKVKEGSLPGDFECDDMVLKGTKGASAAPKAEAPKAEAPKAEAPKVEAPKAEAPKAAAPKKEAPKAEAPKAAAPKKEAPKAAAPKKAASKKEAKKAKAEAKAAAAPKAEAPKKEAPKAAAPKKEAPKKEAPKAAAPKKEAPKAEAPKAEAPKAEAPKAEAPKAEAPKAAAPQAEAPKAEAPKAEAPKKEEPKAEAPKKEKSLDEMSDAEIAKRQDANPLTTLINFILK